MSVTLTINGTGYPFPQTGDENWGDNVTAWATAVTSGMLQKAGGTFTLTAEVDFGATFGLKSAYFKSRATNPAAAGIIRLGSAENVSWRNNANGADLPLTTDSSDNLTFNGHILSSSGGVVPVAAGGTGLSSYTTGDTIYASGSTALSKLGIGSVNTVYVSTGTAPSWALIANANVSGSAAIAYSKLNLSASILNADVNASAAIAYSKLNLSSSIVNADVNASAAIAYSKLNLSASIVNADVNASAGIAYSKLNLSTSVKASDVNSQAALAGDVLTADGAGAATFSTPAAAPDQSYEISNLSIAVSLSSNAATIAIKTKAGSDASGGSPVKAGFRNATPATGTYSQVSITGALSTVISSGSTGGQVSGQPEYTHIYLINNSGTAEVAWSTTRLWDDGVVVTTTAEGGAGAADDRYTLYSTTARSNVPCRYVGYFLSTQAAAGTWVTTPSIISTYQASKFIPRSSIVLNSSPGRGAVNTRIYRFGNVEENVGTDITRATSANSGDSYTINTYGLYFMAFYSNGGPTDFGFSRNSSQLTSDITTITSTDVMAMTSSHSSANGMSTASAMRWLLPGDVIRPHGTATDLTNTQLTHLQICRVL